LIALDYCPCGNSDSVGGVDVNTRLQDLACSYAQGQLSLKLGFLSNCREQNLISENFRYLSVCLVRLWKPVYDMSTDIAIMVSTLWLQ
jgi:hypothetical protein